MAIIICLHLDSYSDTLFSAGPIINCLCGLYMDCWSVKMYASVLSHKEIVFVCKQLHLGTNILYLGIRNVLMPPMVHWEACLSPFLSDHNPKKKLLSGCLLWEGSYLSQLGNRDLISRLSFWGGAWKSVSNKSSWTISITLPTTIIVRLLWLL